MATSTTPPARNYPPGLDQIADLSLRTLLSALNDKIETLRELVAGVQAGDEATTAALASVSSTLTEVQKNLIPQIAAYRDFAEIGDPPTPGADAARLYARDNGSGKTQLVVVFNSGAVQVIATQP